MKSSNFEDIVKGIILGFTTFIFVFSAIPIHTATAATTTGNGKPYFTITLEAPSTNPSRRQWAAIVQNSFSNAGIGANLIYVASFTILSNTIFGPNGNKLFKDGGFDAFFVGAGGGTALPDFGTQNVVYYKGEKTSDFPPVGSNWYFWKNDTYNKLADNYSVTFDPAQRLTIAQKMVKIVNQERPGLEITYPATVYGMSPSLKGWGTNGSAAAMTETTDVRDWQHWSTGNTTVINVAQTGDIDSINPYPTAAQNTRYNNNVYWSAQAGTEEADGRVVGKYFNAVATSITSSSDHLTWTEVVRPHVFQDGVNVTADDYIYTTQSQLLSSVGWVGLGTEQSLVGLTTQFTYLNGTTSYVNNGTYIGHTAPSGWKPSSSWKALNATAFQWTMPRVYIFTDPLVSLILPYPKHLYEQYPTNTWSSSVLSGFTSSGSLSTSSYTYKWDTSKYGGNGSYTAYGPVGDGPYVYKGYDPGSQTATLVKNPLYWNKTGLEKIGEFTATIIHVIHVTEKTAAIAGLGNHAYNVLDGQYTFNKADEAAITAAGGLPVIVSDPSNGYQDLVLNLNSPVWGTGAATPLGQSDPSKAHQAALLVRKAMSYLIPRQDIVNNLLQGIGQVGITEFYDSPTAGIYHDIYNGISPDPYDPNAALGFLAAAGYNTGVTPSSSAITLPSPPVITASCITTTPGGSKTVTVSMPQFLSGNSITLTGTALVVPGTFAGTGGAAITLQQSTDNGTTWTSVALGQTNEGGYYSISYTPTVTGVVKYRVLFTGIPETQVNTLAVSSPARIESYIPPQTATNGLKNLNLTNTQFSPVTILKIGSLADVGTTLSSAINQALGTLSNSTALSVNNGLCGLQKSLSNSTSNAIATLSNNINTALNNLERSPTFAKASDVTTLTNTVNSLNAQIATLTEIAYAALAVAIILGLAAIFLALRKRG